MKLQILSDIHEEFRHKFDSYLWKKSGKFTGDALLLAGDITTVKFIDRLLAVDKPAYYVLGNHEFYNWGWENGITSYKQYLSDHNSPVQVLENETVQISGAVLIAATLWTDFWVPATYGREFQGGYCQRGMADFTVIAGLTVDRWEDRHKKSLRYIEHVLRENKGKAKCVIVMTHHAPSFKSNHEKYENSAICGGFCSNLEYLIEEYQPNYWIHGHCHESFDYKIGNTRVICNPYGYYENGLNSDFNHDLIIEV